MGKGTIISSNGDGSYVVELDYDRTGVDSKITLLESKITETEAMKAAAQAEYDQAVLDIPNIEFSISIKETEIDGIEAELADALDDWYPDEDRKNEVVGPIRARLGVAQGELTALNNQLSTARDTISAYSKRLNWFTLTILSYQQKKDWLSDTNNVPDDEQVTAWCTDYTTDLSGAVGTIEIGRERDKGVNILPGYGGGAAYTGSRDGQLVPLMAQSPAAAFVNLALLPGTQKWKPMFRYGTITAIDYTANTCDISLDATTSSQQGLDINQSVSLEDVPIQYMTCNSAVFTVGDEVVIAFENYNWNTPKVIGFQSNPKACRFEFRLTHQDGSDSLIDDSYTINFYVRNSSGAIVASTATYNAPTESWFINLSGASNGPYWVEYQLSENSVRTQYPFRYKADDKRKAPDLITPGYYEDELPYWKIGEYTYSHTIRSYTPNCTYKTDPAYYLCFEWPGPNCNWGTPASHRNYAFQGAFTAYKNLKTSIPFKATYLIRKDLFGQHCSCGACPFDLPITEETYAQLTATSYKFTVGEIEEEHTYRTQAEYAPNPAYKVYEYCIDDVLIDETEMENDLEIVEWVDDVTGYSETASEIDITPEVCTHDQWDGSAIQTVTSSPYWVKVISWNQCNIFDVYQTNGSEESLSDAEQVAEMIELINQYRKENGLDPITAETSLETAASRHAADMAFVPFLAHEGSDGTTVGDRVDDTAYYEGADSWGVGENVGRTYYNFESMMDSFMNSPAHRANILNPDFIHIGAAVGESTQGEKFWCQVFGYKT